MRNTANLDYEGAIYRPPSEARSIILQATVGCAHNKCTFCVSYKDRKFRIKNRAIIEADLQKAARLYPGVKRLFVADGDALIMPMTEWRWLMPAINEYLPWVERVGVYATGLAIRKKTPEELKWLHDHRLGIIYLGVESGDPQTLVSVQKDSTAEQLIEAGQKVKTAGIELSVTVLLGIAPPGRSHDHGQQTGRLLTTMDPDYVGALSVIFCAGTELEERVSRGEHQVPTPVDLLKELREMLANTELSHGLFMANHASNYLPIKVEMPQGKAEAIALLDAAIRGQVKLRPESFRAL
ncbi:MAG: radical SAM protein [Desulfuromonadaceae bacterium]|nr:radical SAM protein [Desulfuromonadaceae bacterium]